MEVVLKIQRNSAIGGCILNFGKKKEKKNGRKLFQALFYDVIFFLLEKARSTTLAWNDGVLSS